MYIYINSPVGECYICTEVILSNEASKFRSPTAGAQGEVRSGKCI